MKMTIAFDFDGTWTLDPILFNGVARAFLMNGHSVVMITGRSPANSPITDEDRSENLIPPDIPILYSCGELKESFATKRGLTIDVWVDNEPGTIQPQKVVSECEDHEL